MSAMMFNTCMMTLSVRRCAYFWSCLLDTYANAY